MFIVWWEKYISILDNYNIEWEFNEMSVVCCVCREEAVSLYVGELREVFWKRDVGKTEGFILIRRDFFVFISFCWYIYLNYFVLGGDFMYLLEDF